MDTITLPAEEKKGTPSSSKESTAKVVTDRPILKIGGIMVLCILLGTLTGFVGATLFPSNSTALSKTATGEGNSEDVGIKDKKTFKDSATGILREGGIEGEGSFHLERPGGETQNVYLTSSVVDLSAYIGRKVTVWGETFEAEKAGWLMDVGLVEGN